MLTVAMRWPWTEGGFRFSQDCGPEAAAAGFSGVCLMLYPVEEGPGTLTEAT